MTLNEGRFWNIHKLLQEALPLAPGRDRREIWLAKSKHFTLQLAQEEPPERAAPDLLHRHIEHDEIAYVIEADTDFRLGEFTKRLRPGDVVFIPAGHLHGPVHGAKVVLLSIYVPYFDPDNPDHESVS